MAVCLVSAEMIRELAVPESSEWLRIRLGSDTELENEAAIAAHRALGFRETFRLVRFLETVGRERGR